MASIKKAAVSVVLLLTMLTALLSLPVSAAYENTHVNTGNQIEDILAIAATQLGYAEGSNNKTKYGAWYPMDYNPWCAMFVSWCADQAGISTSVIPKHASCDVGVNWFKNKGQWQNSAYHGGSYIPQAGDLIYFGVVGDSDHVGIVRYTSGNTVYTIEGNTSDMVKNKSYSLTYSNILGYGLPAYQNTSGSVSGRFASGANWNINLTTGSLRVYGTGAMDDWALPENQIWGNYRDKVTSVTVEDGITHIGTNAFAGFYYLKSVYIGTGVKTINPAAFMGCLSINTVSLPQKVTSIGNYAFYGCAGLTEATVQNASVTYASQVFYGTPSNFVLKSHANSTTQTYAAANGHKFTSFHTHSLTYAAAKAATCSQTGHVAYWYCSGCKCYYSDSQGANRLTSITTPVNSGNHTPLTHKAAVPATCTQTGTVEHWTCGGCGKYFANSAATAQLTSVTAPKDSNKHGTLTHTAAVPATCTKAGTVEHWTCGGCGKIFADSTAKTPLSSTVSPASPEKHPSLTYHAGVAGSCLEEGIKEHWACTACGKTFADAKGTSILEDLTLPVDPENHADTIYTPGEKSTCCREGAYEYWFCLGCGLIFADEGCTTLLDDFTEPKDPANHEGETEIRGKTDTYTGDTYCLGCDTVIQKGEEMGSSTIASGECGDNAAYTLENGTLTVSGTGAMTDFAAGKAPWHAYRSDITKVVIGKDITHIGDFAFYYCTNLAEVEFEADSKLETIGNGAFGYISALKSITIPASVVEIKANAFYFCTGLETVDFEANSKLQTIGNYAFRQCKALKTAYIPETVTTIGGALLSGAKQATLLVAEASPAHDYAVQNGYLYELRTGERCGYCGENLKWVIKDGVLTVSGYGEMDDYAAGKAPWYGKRGEITKIVIGKNVTSIGKSAFYYMRNLTEVEFTEGSTLKTIGDYAFNYTASLREITIPASVTKLWHYAFNNSADLTAVMFEDGSRLADIGGFVFNGCAKLETVYIPFAVSYIDNARMFTAGAATVLQAANGSVAHDFALSKGYNVELREESMSGTFGEGLTWTLEANGTLTIDGEGAMPEFSYAATGSKAAPWAQLRLLVKKVVIGNGITNIGDFSFFYMNNLEAIEFEENSTLERIGIGVFGYSKKLLNIVLPASLKVIDNYAFYVSPNMETVSFEEGSRLETIGNLIFRECSGLKSFYIPESVKSIGGAILSMAKQATLQVAGLSAGYQHALEYGYKMELRDNVYGGTFGADGTLTWNLNLEDAVLYIGGSGAMEDMSNVTTSAEAAPWMIARPYITKVVIGKDVENIGAYAFYFMTKLAEVEFEAASKVASIGTGAFGYSKILKTITLPASVVEIKANAFVASAGLETVTFEEGSRLTTMGNYVFMNCTALKSVYLPDGVTSIGASILNGAKQATVQVANGSYAHTYAVSKGYKVEVRG